MKRVYVAGPYTSDDRAIIADNIKAAEEYGKQLALAGLTPVIPHSIARNWDIDERFMRWHHTDWMERLCKPLLRYCDAVLMTGRWQQSKGCLMEIEYARQLDIPVYYSVNDVVSHARAAHGV